MDNLLKCNVCKIIAKEYSFVLQMFLKRKVQQTTLKAKPDPCTQGIVKSVICLYDSSSEDVQIS